jgi:hypothetical protein
MDVGSSQGPNSGGMNLSNEEFIQRGGIHNVSSNNGNINSTNNEYDQKINQFTFQQIEIYLQNHVKKFIL